MDPQTILSEPRVVAVPSDRAWLDPRLLVTLFETTFQDVTAPSNSIFQFIKPDPRRAMLGITFPNAVGPNVAIGPWSDPDRFVSGLISSSATVFYTLREHYTLPTLGWFVINGATTTFRVMQVRRL